MVMDGVTVVPDFDTESDEETETSQLFTDITEALSGSSIMDSSPLKDIDDLRGWKRKTKKCYATRQRKNVRRSLLSDHEDIILSDSNKEPFPVDILKLVPFNKVGTPSMSSDDDLPTLESLLSSPSRVLVRPEEERKTLPVKEKVIGGQSSCVMQGLTDECQKNNAGLRRCSIVLKDILKSIDNDRLRANRGSKTYTVSNINSFFGNVCGTDSEESDLDMDFCVLKKVNNPKSRRDIVRSSVGEESSDEERVLPMPKKRLCRVQTKSSKIKQKSKKSSKTEECDWCSSSSDYALESDEEGNIRPEEKTRKRRSPRGRVYGFRNCRTMLNTDKFIGKLTNVDQEDASSSGIYDDCGEEVATGQFHKTADWSVDNMQSVKVLLQPISKDTLMKWKIIL